MNTLFFSVIEEKERDRVRSLEIFDEFEEFHLKCSHYTLLFATKGTEIDRMSLDGYELQGCAILKQQIFSMFIFILYACFLEIQNR